MKFHWPGIQHRVLLIRANGADAYAARLGGVVKEAAFRIDDMELFKGYCQSRARSKFTVLVDLVEEDFRIETIPFVMGPARTQLLERKYDQAYRTTQFRASVSLGREDASARSPDSTRRDEMVLLMALTNQQAITPWLEVMHEERAQIRGVHSIPTVTGWINDHLGSANQSAMFVTLNRSGLRQLYIEEGRPRFSRLASFDDAEAGSAGERIASEIARTEQYLATLRWLPRDGGPLRVVLVCPAEVRANWQIACVNTDRLAYELPDLGVLTRSFGIRTEREDADSVVMHSDALWAAGALRFLPTINFAPSWAREHYTHWLWRTGIIGAGAALCAVGTATGAVLLGQAKTIDFDADRQAANSARANADYQVLAQTFPKTGVTPEYLKGAVLALDPYALRPLTPEPLLIQISQALLAAPAFALTKIDWQVSAVADAAPSSTPFLRPRPAGPAGAKGAGASDRFEIVILTGALVGEKAATPRRKIAAARTAIDALKRIPGADVTPIRLPLDVSPVGNLKGGDVEEALAKDADPVVIRIVRKVAS